MNPILTSPDSFSPLTGAAQEGALAAAVGADVVVELMADQLATAGWGLTEALGLDPVHLAALHAEVVALHEAQGLSAAAIGRGAGQTLAPAIRSDRTAWLDGQSAAQAALFARLAEIQQYLNRSLYLGLTHFEAHFAAFTEGAFYRPHRDSFQGRASRRVSLVLYLNQDWAPEDGGALRILFGKAAGKATGDGALAVEILPEMGRAVFFLSEQVLHEVIEARRTRYSIACWFRADPAENLTFIR